MNQWVALLRGINVGGINIKSAELAQAFRDHGLHHVKTVLATGNVLFDADPAGLSNAEALRSDLEAMLSQRFGYEARIVLETQHRVAELAHAYPYSEGPTHHAYVVFTSAPADLEALLEDARSQGITVDEASERTEAGDGVVVQEKTLNEGEERVSPADGALYWACPRGSSTTTPFSKLTSAARHKRALTTRNLNTVRKLF